MQDMFAYRECNRIEFSECTLERNIIVVSGRNGAGKTSLLNAAKLLFLGANSESMRRIRVGDSPLNPKQFMIGVPGRWYGVFPRDGRRDGMIARVALFWEESGAAYSAERSFTLTRQGNDYTEKLQITRNGRALSLSEEDADARLQTLLPNEVVPFFFFDGEQIQSLADADVGRESAEIERLLGLSFLNDIDRQLDVYVKERRRAGLPETVRHRITEMEGEQKSEEARAESARRLRIALEEEIADLETAKARAEEARKKLRSGLSEEERSKMGARIENLRRQREALASQIASKLPLEAPFLTNLGLVDQAFRTLDDQLKAGTAASLANRLHADLPPGVIALLAALEPTVALHPRQSTELIKGLGWLLTKIGVPADSFDHPIFASVAISLRQQLRDRFLTWHQSGQETLAAHADLLRQMRALNIQLRQAQRDLDDADVVSDEAKRRYEQLTNEIEMAEAEIRRRLQETVVHEQDESRAARNAAQLSDRIRAGYEEHADVLRENKAYVLSRSVRLALQTYRQERRAAIRASVEERLRAKVAVLLGPSRLIKSASLNENFVMTYQDEDGEDVARQSISAGMRQLVAMAMLWALKEEADRPLPVMIDTPLGRIDRENRNLLMNDYFPHAGNPLVLLPTNSEFGDQGFDQLSEHICKRYEIQNHDGRSASIVELSLQVAH
ncbi:AAA family ATPase [Mesorhizobium sp. M1A.F.Ca.ET.072.01.1.1]|uniref:AAA family ATPase n=1 Tax=Mesorhizobium sp. M1A.F.Ca.ET.072.01.1.1 TaxID=2496753 RepID=UPI002479FBAD|nr:AAA family ATPase [Mesorhizobium sp. M1A.F.Ca.ET.072.01.1.1]